MPVVGGSQGDVAWAVQAQPLYLGRIACQRCRRYNLQHAPPRGPHRGRPGTPLCISGGRRYKGQPVLVCLPEQPVRLVHHLQQGAESRHSCSS